MYPETKPLNSTDMVKPFVGQSVSPDLHPDEALLGQRVGLQRFHVHLKAPDIPLVLLDLLREVFEKLILHPVLFALVVRFHDLELGHLHVQVHAFFDAGVPGAQGLDLRKGEGGFIDILAGPHRAFAGHDL